MDLHSSFAIISELAISRFETVVQSDVWSFYDEASIYGKEVFTMGGGRGPSLAYYVPSLSAMQLFLPVHPEAAHAHAASQVYRLSDSLTAKVYCLEHWIANLSTAWESLIRDRGRYCPAQVKKR